LKALQIGLYTLVGAIILCIVLMTACAR
jgi:hypothetical protein